MEIIPESVNYDVIEPKGKSANTKALKSITIT